MIWTREKKMKEDEEILRKIKLNSTFVSMSAEGERVYSSSSISSSTTNKNKASYKDLQYSQFELDSKLGQYLQVKQNTQTLQNERLHCVGNCNRLISQLSHAPSLDDAKKTITTLRTSSISAPSDDDESKKKNEKTWFTNVPMDALPNSVSAHLLSIETMSSNTKWNVVSAPQDMTTAPIDVLQLSTTDKNQLLDENKGNYVLGNVKTRSNIDLDQKISNDTYGDIAKSWSNGDGIHDSLFWVNYAVQASKYDRGAKEKRVKDVADGLIEAEGQIDQLPIEKISKTLGIDVGHEILQNLASDASTRKRRVHAMKQTCSDDLLKIETLSSEFANKSIALLHHFKAENLNDNILALEAKARYDAAVKIQALVRGLQTRVVINSQRKIMQAFGILVSELSRPQLRPNTRDNMIGLPNIPIDAATLRNFVSNKDVTNKSISNNNMNITNKSRDKGSNSRSPSSSSSSTSRKNKGGLSYLLAKSSSLSTTPGRRQMKSRVDEERNTYMVSPNSNLPRTPLANYDINRAVQESRLSAATGGTLRESMDSSHDGPGDTSQNLSGMGYVSSPSESMSQSAVSLTLFASPQRNATPQNAGGNTDGTIPSRPVSIQHIMDKMIEVTQRVQNGECSVTEIVTNALKANVANFAKDGALAFLTNLVTVCEGPASITSWLQHTVVNGNTNDNQSLLEVANTSMLLGDLGRELGFLNDAHSGPYQLISIVLFMRLLAQNYEDGYIRLSELGLLLEDIYLQSQGEVEKQTFVHLNKTRLDLLNLANLRNTTTEKMFLAALEKIGCQRRVPMTLDNVKSMLSRIGGLSGATLNTVSEMLMTFIVGDKHSTCAPDDVMSLLCVVPSFNHVQNKLKAWLNSCPSMFESIKKETMMKVEAIKSKLSEDHIVDIFTSTNIPFTRLECVVIAHIVGSLGKADTQDKLYEAIRKISSGFLIH
jgi:hypothetical protein